MLLKQILYIGDADRALNNIPVNLKCIKATLNLQHFFGDKRDSTALTVAQSIKK